MHRLFRHVPICFHVFSCSDMGQQCSYMLQYVAICSTLFLHGPICYDMLQYGVICSNMSRSMFSRSCAHVHPHTICAMSAHKKTWSAHKFSFKKCVCTYIGPISYMYMAY